VFRPRNISTERGKKDRNGLLLGGRKRGCSAATDLVTQYVPLMSGGDVRRQDQRRGMGALARKENFKDIILVHQREKAEERVRHVAGAETG